MYLKDDSVKATKGNSREGESALFQRQRSRLSSRVSDTVPFPREGPYFDFLISLLQNSFSDL